MGDYDEIPSPERADAYYTAKAAMRLLEKIPDEIYPPFDDCVTDAVNSLDDALSNMQWLFGSEGDTVAR